MLMTVVKWVAGLGLLFVLIVGGAGAFLYGPIKEMIAQQQNGQMGTAVRLEAIEYGRLVRTVSAPGRVIPEREVNISARVSAKIMSITVEPGDYLNKDDLLVQLEDRDFQAALDSATARLRGEEARLEGSRASFINATAEWERQEALFGTNDVSRSSLDAAEAELRRAEANLRAAEQNVDVAKAEVVRNEENLSYTKIFSPLSGYATRVNMKVGEIALGTSNNIGSTIMTLADFSEIDVVAEVDESDIAQVKIGQPAGIYINAFEDDVFEGTVELIDLLKSTSRSGSDIFEVRVKLHAGDDKRVFFAGLTASVDIEVETLEDVLIAPSQAVLDVRIDELPAETRDSEYINQDKTYARVVYVIEDGKAVAKPVDVGTSNIRMTALKGGIEPGQKVIAGPYRVLVDLKNGEAVYDEKLDDDKKDATATGDDNEGSASEDKAESAEAGATENEAADEQPSETQATQPEDTNSGS